MRASTTVILPQDEEKLSTTKLVAAVATDSTSELNKDGTEASIYIERTEGNIFKRSPHSAQPALTGRSGFVFICIVHAIVWVRFDESRFLFLMVLIWVLGVAKGAYRCNAYQQIVMFSLYDARHAYFNGSA